MERGSGNGCEVRIILDQHEGFLNQTDQHNHPPNPEIIAVKKISSCYRSCYGKNFPGFSYFATYVTSKIITNYDKRGKCLPILHKATSNNYFIVKCLLKSNVANIILLTY